MRKVVLLILLIVMLPPAFAAYRDPYMTIPEEVDVHTGETAHIEVTLRHVQTTMWSLKVYVDTTQIESRFLERLHISADPENPIQFEEEIPNNTEVTASIDITVVENSPPGEVRIPIVAAGNKGPCLKGCEPFFVQKSVTMVIERQDPKLAVVLPEAQFKVLPGESVQVEIQLKNYGAATAYIKDLEVVLEEGFSKLMGDAPSRVEAGVTESVIVTLLTGDAPPGNYLIQVKLEYQDQIQNTFTDSRTVYVTILQNEEPPPSQTPVISTPPPTTNAPSGSSQEKYQYFVAGMFTGGAVFGVSVMVGLFLKKRRPTKQYLQ
jgi:hypothetical protein